MIRVEGIRKSYGKKAVLTNVNLSLETGEQAAIIGRNGCGKTTLMHIMAGITKPDAGSVSYFGHNIFKEKRTVAKYCGYLPQGDCLLEELSVQDNISLWSGKSGAPSGELTDFFDLKEILKVPVKNLSGGMKRRVSIACTMVGWPPVLLLDEPTGGLDRYYKAEIRELMGRYRALNGILVIVTHDEEEIKTCSRCFELSGGVLKEAT
ncbi:MAG: ABC transporter ATP-binding protein [Lachnospiraceae bacterium]|nr:ABC transporter ATP-binding protein [Lachnospiraceae bacterium]